eukprot:194695-Pleurochrysis_carterae.AAC.1
MAFALPANSAPGRGKHQTASFTTNERRVTSYMKKDKARDLGIPEGMPPAQIPRIDCLSLAAGPIG